MPTKGRKSGSLEPSVNHLLKVANLADATDGSPDAAVAAHLYDVVQNGKGREAQIGGSVACFAAELIDDKSLAKDERKRRHVVFRALREGAAWTIKLADKTANMRAIA